MNILHAWNVNYVNKVAKNPENITAIMHLSIHVHDVRHSIIILNYISVVSMHKEKEMSLCGSIYI